MSTLVAYRPHVADDLREWSRLSLQWLEDDRSARLIIDQGMTVLWANKRALDLAEASLHFMIRLGRLWLGPHHTEFRRSLAQTDKRSQRFCTALDGEARNQSLVICARKLESDGDTVFGVTARHWNNPDIGEAARVFGLTDSETRIVEQLFVLGMTAQESAKASGLSIETVRTHIRRLYAKLDVNSREAMFVKLRPFLFNF